MVRDSLSLFLLRRRKKCSLVAGSFFLSFPMTHRCRFSDEAFRLLDTYLRFPTETSEFAAEITTVSFSGKHLTASMSVFGLSRSQKL